MALRMWQILLVLVFVICDRGTMAAPAPGGTVGTPGFVIPPLPQQGPFTMYINVNTDNDYRGRVRGRIVMTQAAPGQAVTISTSLWYVPYSEYMSNPPPVAASSGHQWRIHQKAIIKPYECATAGAVYDPQGLMSSGAYQCTTANTAGCAAGDLGGKFGTLSIGVAGAPEIGNFVDQAPSYSLFDIYQMSVVIYMNNAAVDLSNWQACGIVEQPITVTATFDGSGCIDADDPNGVQGVSGTVVIAQSLDGGVTMTSTLSTVAGGPASIEHPMHIHKKGIRTKRNCAGAGPHYDPFFKQMDPWGKEDIDYSCDPANPLNCFVGDITGKHGPIDLPAQQLTITDPNIDLWDILGRSLVIHTSQGSSRISMAAIPGPMFCTDEMWLLLTASMIGLKLVVLVIVQFVAE